MNTMKRFLKSTVCVGLLAAVTTSYALTEVDPDLPAYKPVSGISGNLNSKGSDTLNNLMTKWAEAFRVLYPNVNIQIEGAGSSTAPAALIEGTAQIGPMSRSMRGEEIDAFEKRFGHRPTEVKCAIDALAVYAHKDNPVKGMTMQQVDGVFSSTFRLGGANVSEWGQLGVDGWAGRAISVYGRNSASGTYGFFKEVALGNGDFKSSVKEQPGSSAVVQGVSSDLYGIGYSGLGYRTSGVRVVPLGTEAGKYFDATFENCLSGDYPLARYLFVYVNKKPGEAMDPLTHEFLKFVLSKEGQQIVAGYGFYPMPAAVAAEVAKSFE